MFRLSSLILLLGAITLYLGVTGWIMLTPLINESWAIWGFLAVTGLLGWLPAILHIRSHPEENIWIRRLWLLFYFLAPPALFLGAHVLGSFCYILNYVWTQPYEPLELLSLPFILVVWAVFFLGFFALHAFSYLAAGLLLKWCFIPAPKRV